MNSEDTFVRTLIEQLSRAVAELDAAVVRWDADAAELAADRIADLRDIAESNDITLPPALAGDSPAPSAPPALTN